MKPCIHAQNSTTVKLNRGWNQGRWTHHYAPIHDDMTTYLYPNTNKMVPNIKQLKQYLYQCNFAVHLYMIISKSQACFPITNMYKKARFILFYSILGENILRHNERGDDTIGAGHRMQTLSKQLSDNMWCCSTEGTGYGDCTNRAQTTPLG